VPARLSRLFLGFFDSERASGLILIACTLASLLLANVLIGPAWLDFWHAKLPLDIAGVISVNYTLEHWINDGLMTVFFLLIGLEIERELYVGELSNLRAASLPIVAALGGMLTPVLIHFAFNQGTPTQRGIAIPMATDIAFALGALSLLGRRVPVSLKIFLTALAIIDDLGAIAVIGIFYAMDFSLPFLLGALAVFAGLLLLNRLGVRRLAFYLIPGALMWYLMGKSGIHATITGVLLAFAIPFAGGSEESPSARLERFLGRPVAFLIMPLFTLANTGIALSGDWARGLFSSNGLGIYLGLLLGKPLGIVGFSLAAVKAGLSRLPADLSWKHVLGGGFLGGIGFTMSIFITLLAFADPGTAQASKIAILLASLSAGIVGIAILARQLLPNSEF
jgi:NhaA family Na+:H+ antiporter